MGVHAAAAAAAAARLLVMRVFGLLGGAGGVLKGLGSGGCGPLCNVTMYIYVYVICAKRRIAMVRLVWGLGGAHG